MEQENTSGQILIDRDVYGYAKGSKKGAGTSSARKTLQWSVFSEMGLAGPKNRQQEKPRAKRYNQGNCSVHPQINIKFQKVNWAVMSNNKP
jgi:hypothetical protein